MRAKEKGASVPSVYVTNGLIFFLDGKQLATASKWTDIVGGKEFSLTNCSINGGGVVFDGSSSYGAYNGAISSDWESETIEAAIDTTMANSRDILNQPIPGISLRLSLTDGNMRVVLRAGGGKATYCMYPSSVISRVVSGIKGKAVVNKTTYTGYDYVIPTAAVSTTIGARNTSGNTYSAFFPGTIYAIRIYNRQLTEAEMLQNQQADIDRYGITL